MMAKTEMSKLPPCLIFIDKEGRWYHKGAEMIHREFIRLFYKHMELDPQGRYVINWQGQRCWVDVEDTAFVVRRATFKDGTQAQNAQYLLHLSDDTERTSGAGYAFCGAGQCSLLQSQKPFLPGPFQSCCILSACRVY